MIRRFVQLKPGGQISAAEINRAFEEIQRSATFTVSAPLELVQGAQGNLLRVRDTPGTGTTPANVFTVELTEDPAGNYLDGDGVWHPAEDNEEMCEPGVEARCDCPNGETPTYLPRGYGWRAVAPDVCGGWGGDPPFEDVGTPCARPLYDINGNTIPLLTNGHPTRVRIWQAMAPEDGCNQFQGFYHCDYQVGLSDPCCGTTEDNAIASGADGFGTPAECLFNCGSVSNGRWAVKIGGHWYPVCAIDENGDPITE